MLLSRGIPRIRELRPSGWEGIRFFTNSPQPGTRPENNALLKRVFWSLSFSEW